MGANVDHGVMVKTTEDHKNGAADRGCVSHLVGLLILAEGLALMVVSVSRLPQGWER